MMQITEAVGSGKGKTKMIKTFENRNEALKDLLAHKFYLQGDRSYTNDEARAMIHPIRGSEKVHVSIWLLEEEA